VRAAWRVCRRLLARWVGTPAATLSAYAITFGAVNSIRSASLPFPILLTAGRFLEVPCLLQ
jgi:hypothetical protein